MKLMGWFEVMGWCAKLTRWCEGDGMVQEGIVMVCEGNGWCVKVKESRMKVMERCVKVMIGWFVKMKGCCDGYWGLYASEGMVCEDDGMVCKGDVMSEMVMGRCVRDGV